MEDDLFAKFLHIGFVVKNLEKAIENLQSLGAGPFKYFDPAAKPIECISEEHFGKQFDPYNVNSMKFKAAFGSMGPLNIELIEPIAEGTAWEKFLKSKGEGIHHLCFLVDDINKAEAKVTAQGFKRICQRVYKKGGGMGYFENGVVRLELSQKQPE